MSVTHGMTNTLSPPPLLKGAGGFKYLLLVLKYHNSAALVSRGEQLSGIVEFNRGDDVS